VLETRPARQQRLKCLSGVSVGDGDDTRGQIYQNLKQSGVDKNQTTI